MVELQCEQCGAAVDERQQACPHCFARLPSDIANLKHEQRRTWLKVTLGGIVTLGFAMVVVSGLSEPTQSYDIYDNDSQSASPASKVSTPTKQATAPTTKPSAPKIVNITHNGPVVIGRRHGKGVLGAKLFATLEIKEHIAENPTTYDEFQAAGLMFGAAAHTKGIVRDVSWSGPVKVELLSGVNAGRVGWIDREYILEGGEWER